MTGDAYFVGRAVGTIAAPFRASDHIFGSQRLDGDTLEHSVFEHCTFANISFKATRLDGGRFLNCAFVACFFRKADMRSCSFSSCRFIDCEFPDASFAGCDFRYTRFSGCYIPFDEIEHNLPTEPNLREQLSHNLAREAAVLGDSRTARTFRLCEVSARESHYWAVVCGKSKWYREHYDGFARLRTALRLVVSKLNGWLFGYGERLWFLFRNYGIATFVVFPLLFYAVPDALLVPPDTIDALGSRSALSTALEFSLDSAVAGALRSPIEAAGAAARMLAAAQIVLTAIWVSLTAGYLFRWSLLR